MAYKLINPEGTVHDFAHKMSWGHNIEGSNKPTRVVEYDGLATYEFQWDVFHWIPIKTGDFIIRNRAGGGNILLYEVVHAERKKFNSPFGPNDCYEVTAQQCGYFDRERNVKLIGDCYGMKRLSGIQKTIQAFISTKKED